MGCRHLGMKRHWWSFLGMNSKNCNTNLPCKICPLGQSCFGVNWLSSDLACGPFHGKQTMPRIICFETNKQLQFICLLELYDQEAYGPRAVTCYCYLTTLAQHQLHSKYLYLSLALIKESCLCREWMWTQRLRAAQFVKNKWQLWLHNAWMVSVPTEKEQTWRERILTRSDLIVLKLERK